MPGTIATALTDLSELDIPEDAALHMLSDARNDGYAETAGYGPHIRVSWSLPDGYSVTEL